MTKFTYEVRQVDAWNYDGEWTYNQTWLVGTFKTAANDLKRALIRYLNKKGIHFKHSQILINSEWDSIEILDRKTKEPLYCMIYHDKVLEEGND